MMPSSRTKRTPAPELEDAALLDEDEELLVVLLELELELLLVLVTVDVPEELVDVDVVETVVDVDPEVEEPEVLVSEDKEEGGVEVCVAVEPVVSELAEPDDAIENMGL